MVGEFDVEWRSYSMKIEWLPRQSHFWLQNQPISGCLQLKDRVSLIHPQRLFRSYRLRELVGLGSKVNRWLCIHRTRERTPCLDGFDCFIRPSQGNPSRDFKWLLLLLITHQEGPQWCCPGSDGPL